MATNNKHYIKRLFLAAVILLASLTGAGAQTFTFECFGGFLTAADANCDICNSTVSSRLFNGLLIRKNGTVTYWIDCPYIVKQQGQNLVFQEIIPSPQTVTIAIAGTGFSTIQGFKDSTACMCARQDSSWIGGGGDPSITNEGILGVAAGGANDALLTSNTSGANGVTYSGSTTIKTTETTSSNGGTILFQADTSILATLNDLRAIIDTVEDYGRLRLYNGAAYLVFVKKNKIQGLFRRVSGSFTDDGGITIVGTNKWRRVADRLSFVNVQWFGAIGDSITNDNSAIQAAVAWVKDSANATLYFPKGKYRYTQTISFYKPQNIAIQGEGMNNTYLFPVNVSGIIIRSDSTTTIFDPVYGTKEARDVTISKFTMIRSGANNFNGKIRGIDIRGWFNGLIEEVSVKAFFGQGGTGQGSIGIRLWPTLATDDASQHTTLRNVWVAQCDTGIVSRLQNTVRFDKVSVDANKDVGVALSNGVFWTGGMCQANENTGIWIRNSDPFPISQISIEDVHFEGNAYVAPKWGGIYKNDNVDMTNLRVSNCALSSPGNTHLFRLRRVQGGFITNNRYSGSATTDTIALTSIYNVMWGHDNYTALKLITSDCYIKWLNGTLASNDAYVGFSVGTATAGSNVLNVGGNAAIGATYAVTNTAPTNGMIVQGNVGIANTSPAQTFHVTGTARITGSDGTATTITGRDSDGDISNVAVGTGLSLTGGTLSSTAGSVAIPDSTWAKSVGGGYANKRITDPVYRSSAIRVNMTGDSAALTLKYASTQTAPIFRTQFNNGTASFYAHSYQYNNTNSLTNSNLVFGSAGTVHSLAFKNTVFGITGAQFPTGVGNNSLFGYLAGNALNGGYENSAFGGDAGASLSTGFQNSFFGYLAGAGTNTGYQNMFIGRRAGTTNQDGFSNIAIGADALRLNVTGDLNVAIGQQTGDGILGSSNTLIGAAAGRLTTGSGNIFIGYSAGELLTSVSNLLAIDNTNTSSPLIGGDLSSNEVSINLDPATAARSLDVNGEVRIRDLTTDNPTRLVGADGDGDLDTVGIGAEAELHITNGTLGTNFHTTISPSNLTAGMTNNWNPTGLATAWIIRMSGDDKFEIVTGITAPSFAKRLTIHNTGSNAILFATDNTSSTAGNRFSFGRDIVLFAGKSIEIIYDPTSARWRLLSKAGIYDDIENQYFNTAFQAPVSLTTAEHDFWEISSTGTATAVTPTNGLLRGVSVNTGTSATGCGDVASKEQFVSVNTVDGAATWGYVKAKIVTPSSLSNGTNDYALRIGFLAGECSSDLVEGAYFYYNHAINSGAWSCYTQNAGNSQNNNSGITVAASTIYTLEVVYRPNISVEFFINGTRVATNDTNVPDSDTMKVLAEIEKQGGTSQRDLQVYLLQTSIAHVN